MLLQQGDVLLNKRNELPQNLKKIEKRECGIKKGLRIILAEGEVTGHAHAISENLDQVELYEDSNGTLWLKNSTDVEIEHEEHDNFNIPKGIWEVGIVKEYDPFEEEIRKVKD